VESCQHHADLVRTSQAHQYEGRKHTILNCFHMKMLVNSTARTKHPNAKSRARQSSINSADPEGSLLNLSKLPYASKGIQGKRKSKVTPPSSPSRAAVGWNQSVCGLAVPCQKGHPNPNAVKTQIKGNEEKQNRKTQNNPKTPVLHASAAPAAADEGRVKDVTKVGVAKVQ
jgi:hypothetical protein